MKCTICGTHLNPLDYSQITMSDVQTLQVMDQDITSKSTTLDYNLCRHCADNIRTILIADLILQDGEENCNGDCANCDGAR